jgi:hypothetical protein
MKFMLFHHKNKALAQYVKECSTLNRMESENLCEIDILSSPQQNIHKSFAELPESLRKLLFFAKPDLVICLDDNVRPIRPIFAFELTTHVPARDHWMQRFVNLVGCAQEGVPGAYVIPFSMPERENFSGEIDDYFFFAYERVMEIHKTPFYIAQWESLDGKTLNRDALITHMPNRDSKDIVNAFKFLNLVLDTAIHGRDVSNLMGDRLIVELRNQIRQRAYKQVPRISDFQRLYFNMGKDDFLTIQELKNWLKLKGLSLPARLPDRIKKRNKNLIYVPQSTQVSRSQEALRRTLLKRVSKKGGDPYTGQPLAFDYMFCRLGPTPYERDVNVIIDLSVLKFSDLAKYHRQVWEQCPLRYEELNQLDHVPRYTMYLTEGCPHVTKNFLRIYAFTADLIAFKDGLVYF